MSRAVEDRRAALGLTPTQFAQAAGLTPEGLVKVRRGERRNYQEKTTRGVAKALCWPTDWYQRLLDGEDAADFPPGAPSDLDDRRDEITQLRSEVENLKKVVQRLARAIETRPDVPPTP